VGCELDCGLHWGEISPLAMQKVRLARAIRNQDIMNSSEMIHECISAVVLAPPND
jgi:hypothetical protein